MKTVNLTTKYEKELQNQEIPFSEYPRPQLKRESFLCLNGEWDFIVKDKKGVKFNGKIVVPFAPECRLSKVNLDIGLKDQLIYTKKFTFPNGFVKEKTILHVGACDQYASVYINDAFIGENVGVLEFSFDISDYIKQGENVIKIIAKDPLNKDIPYGKQRVDRGGMWYTKISGIWKTVWIESLPKNYIKNVKITPDLKGVNVEVFGGEENKKIILDGKEYLFKNNIRIDIENPVLWSPENPKLYYFTLTDGKDTIDSYFGLRTIDITKVNGKKYIALNGKPYFFHGLLDQGYFSDGIYLPATKEGFIDDILNMKKCGFNTLRKHIKYEPDLFYYYCDKYGMLVFQDMINSGKYSFFIDTALPTIGLKKGITHRASKFRKSQFISSMKGVIDGLYNYPCVVYYTIFNEGWGQFSVKENYRLAKQFDSSRIYDSTSGWFKKPYTDVESDHVYFKKIKPKTVKDKPWVLSEFGGYSYRVNEHVFNLDKEYGYKKFAKSTEFENALISLYEDQIIPAIKSGLCATVLTQVSDVEDEINGLITYDRKVLKVDPEKFSALSQKLKTEFDKSVKNQ